jgi:hypothetical protein
MDTSGELYILTGQKPLEVEDTENLVLLAIHASKGSLRAWTATDMELFGGLSGIIIRYLLDPFELLHHARLTDIDSSLVQPPMKGRHKRQCQNAVECMYPKHLVRPMMGRGKADEIGIFHIPEGSLDVMLAAIAKYDFFVGKILAVRKQDSLAENSFLQFVVGLVVGSKCDAEPSMFTRNLSPKKISDILARNDLIQILLKAFLSVRFTSPSGFMAAGNTFLKIPQCLQLFGKMLPYAADLPLEQSATSSDYDRAFLSKNLFLRAMNANALEQRTFKVAEPLQGNGQKVLVLGGNKRSYKMVGGTVQDLNVFLRIVPFVENQRNALTFFFEHLVAGNEIIQNLAEGDRVVLIPLVSLGKQRNVKIPRNQQGQADNAKICPFGFGVSSLSQLGPVVRGKKRIEVGSVVKESTQIDVQLFHNSPRNIVFDLGKNRLVKVVHMVPEPLTPQSYGADGEEPAQDSIPVPCGEFALAGRCNRPVKGRQQYILPYGSALIAFRGVAVDRADDVQLLSRVPESGGGAEIPLLGKERAPWSLRQEAEQLLGGAEMAHYTNARPTALIPIRFDDAPVTFSPDRIGLKARHDSYIHDLVQPVNRNRNIWW